MKLLVWPCLYVSRPYRGYAIKAVNDECFTALFVKVYIVGKEILSFCHKRKVGFSENRQKKIEAAWNDRCSSQAACQADLFFHISYSNQLKCFFLAWALGKSEFSSENHANKCFLEKSDQSNRTHFS